MINIWIHEHKNWPDFSWDAATLASKLADIRHRQGRLLGRMEGLSFELKCEASLYSPYFSGYGDQIDIYLGRVEKM